MPDRHMTDWSKDEKSWRRRRLMWQLFVAVRDYRRSQHSRECKSHADNVSYDSWPLTCVSRVVVERSSMSSLVILAGWLPINRQTRAKTRPLTTAVCVSNKGPALEHMRGSSLSSRRWGGYSAVYMLSSCVCLYVRPSVTRQYCTKNG